MRLRPVLRAAAALWIAVGLGLIEVSARGLRAETSLLYEGDLGTLPGEQGWIYFALPLGQARATQRMQDGAALLDSQPAKGDQAGWFRTLEPRPGLDRDAGFTIHFDLRLEREDHAGSDKDGDGRGDRAGLSLILLSRDLMGIELGIWPDRIWAQEGGPTEPPRFSQAEGSPIALGTDMHRYALRVQGASYALHLDDDAEALLEGPLRDYSAEGFPYTTAGFVFVGDDTASASARFALARVAIDTALPSATEPATPSPMPVEPSPTQAATATEPGAALESQPAYLPLLVRPRNQPTSEYRSGPLRRLIERLLR